MASRRCAVPVSGGSWRSRGPLPQRRVRLVALAVAVAGISIARVAGAQCVIAGAPSNPLTMPSPVTTPEALLTWSAATGTAPITYTVYLDGAAVAGCSAISAPVCRVSGLTSGYHQWKVTASNCAGSGGTGGPWGLTVNLPCVPVVAVDLVAPPDAAVGTGAGPALQWLEPATGSLPFTYDVTLDGQAVTACTGISALACQLAGLAIDARAHSWSVTAHNACGSATSVTRSFSTCAATALPVPAFSWLEQGPLEFHGMRQALPFVNQVVHLRDTSTGTPTAWHWDLGDGLVSGDQNPARSWPSAGSHPVTLTATNCVGTSPPAVATVVVYDDIRPVTADFTWSPATGTPGAPMTFTAATGFELGDPTSFDWTFPGGATASGEIVSFAFECSDTVAVTLVARRGGIASAPTSKLVPTTGAPVCCHPPNRAGDPHPTSGATVPGGAVTLQWARPSQGTDQLAYDVYLDGALLTGCSGLAVPLCVTQVPDGAAIRVWKVIARNGCGDTTSFPDTPAEWQLKACSPPSAPDASAFTWQPSGAVEIDGVRQQQPYVGQTVTFSYDPLAPATSLTWSDGQSSPATVYDGVPHPAVVYAAPGDMPMRLVAGNCAGVTTIDQLVTVYPDRRPVHSSFTFSPQAPSALEPVTITFDASLAAGDPNEFTVDFGDGSAAETTGATSVQHVFACARSYAVAVIARRVKAGSTVESIPVAREVVLAGVPCSPSGLILVDLPRRAALAGGAGESGGFTVFNPDEQPMLLELSLRDTDSGQLRQGLALPLLPPQGIFTLDDLTALLGIDFGRATVWLRNAEEGRTALPVVSAWRCQQPAGGARFWQVAPVFVTWAPSNRYTTGWLAGLEHDSVGSVRDHTGFVTRLTFVDPTLVDAGRAPWGARKLALTLVDGRSGALLAAESLDLDSFGGYRSDYLNRFFHLPDALVLGPVAVRVEAPPGVSAVATAAVCDNASGSCLVVAAVADR
jgi:PKD repeat protein